MGCVPSKAEVIDDLTRADTIKAGSTRTAATEPAATPVNGRPVEPRGQSSYQSSYTHIITHGRPV